MMTSLGKAATDDYPRCYGNVNVCSLSVRISQRVVTVAEPPQSFVAGVGNRQSAGPFYESRLRMLLLLKNDEGFPNMVCSNKIMLNRNDA
jgi:hypothetical protein